MGTIQRANLDGSQVEDLVTGLSGPLGIALDVQGGRIYWTENWTDKIQRANLDGSHVEDLAMGLRPARGIALFLPDREDLSPPDDYGDKREAATELTTSVEGRIESDGDVDYFRIEIPERSYVTIHTTGSLDTVGVVERQIADGSAEEIARQSDGGEGRNFRVAGPAEAGTYYLQVTSLGAEIGNYRVHLDVSPVLSLPLSVGDQISGRARHTCALRPDGTPVCWGSNIDGAATPPPGVQLVALSTGGAHTCGLQEDGTPVCWGSDVFGRSTPPAGERFTSISSGSQHTCALRPDGVPVCWGSDRYGRVTPPGYDRKLWTEMKKAHPPKNDSCTNQEEYARGERYGQKDRSTRSWVDPGRDRTPGSPADAGRGDGSRSGRVSRTAR